MKVASWLDRLPPYLFAEIEKKTTEMKARGIDIISLGIGDPDRPTYDYIIDEMEKKIHDPSTHRYPSYYGMKEFREAVSAWYKKRFGIDLDPETEVLPLIGSKEGIAHVCSALLDPGDTMLVPDPGYPVYETGTIIAGGYPHYVPLLENNDFLPDLDSIDSDMASKAKGFFLNYPNNPTSATCDLSFFEKTVAFANKYDVAILHDFAYSELTFDGYKAPSFLQAAGAKDVGIEFHSLSKTYNMTGWRIGFAVGNRKLIEALGRVKTNIDSGIFNAIQYAGITALAGGKDEIQAMCELYMRRRDKVMNALAKVGIEARSPKATIYVWAKVPAGYDSAGFASHILEQAHVIVSPGSAYGPSGEGYFRICLSTDDTRLEEALQRISDNL